MSESNRPSLLLLLAVIADASAVATLFGFSERHQGWLIASATLSTMLIAAGAGTIWRQRKALDMAGDLIPVLHLSETIARLSFDSAKEIFCLGSGTETYYSLLEPRLREGLISRGIKIHIGFRVGYHVRSAKLTEYQDKWNALARTYGLDLQFYPVSDFDHALRGLVVDDRVGAVGLYFRRGGQTFGGDSEVLLVSRDTEAGRFLIEGFRRVFEGRQRTVSMIPQGRSCES